MFVWMNWKPITFAGKSPSPLCVKKNCCISFLNLPFTRAICHQVPTSKSVPSSLEHSHLVAWFGESSYSVSNGRYNFLKCFAIFTVGSCNFPTVFVLLGVRLIQTLITAISRVDPINVKLIYLLKKMFWLLFSSVIVLINLVFFFLLHHQQFVWT